MNDAKATDTIVQQLRSLFVPEDGLLAKRAWRPILSEDVFVVEKLKRRSISSPVWRLLRLRGPQGGPYVRHGTWLVTLSPRCEIRDEYGIAMSHKELGRWQAPLELAVKRSAVLFLIPQGPSPQ